MAGENLLIKVARLNLIEGSGKTKAYADVVLNESFLVKGFRVVEGKNGLFIGMPGRFGDDGKWYDTTRPVSEEVKEALSDSILAAYKDRQQGGE